MTGTGLFASDAGQTPISPDEVEGLLDPSVATRADLNEVEEANIARGRRRWWRRPLKIDDVLNVAALRRLHKDMFGDVWSWAGTYRHTDVAVTSVSWTQIPVMLTDLVDDISAQTKAASTAGLMDEVGCRFHHRLVWIHPFPNGNGRHGREATDLLMRAAGGEPFTWGRRAVTDGRITQAQNRHRYLRALRAADGHDEGPLTDFVRT